MTTITKTPRYLPEPPKIRVLARYKCEENVAPYLEVDRNLLEIKYPDLTVSERFRFDTVKRKHQDAVAIVAHFFSDELGCHVYLRSCVRPALLNVECSKFINQWELPAGLIEDNEDPREAASRELLEEVGFNISPDVFKPLGNFFFPAVGHFPERIYLYEVNVGDDNPGPPRLDGSALEKHGQVIHVSIEDAIMAISSGEIRDAKTQIGLMRWRYR